jgi:site-specific recombinase XerD
LGFDVAHSGAEIRQLLLAMRNRLGEQGLGEKVEKAWLYWARDFLLSHQDRKPEQLDAADVRSHVRARAQARRVSQAVEHQMTRACVFMLRNVVGSGSPELTLLWQSTQSPPRPVILSPGQVQSLLEHLDGEIRLMASLSYSAGLRIRECVRLRVRDIKDHRIVVCDSMGRPARETVLPERVRDPLRSHLEKLKIRHIRELADGFGGVQLPLNSGVPSSACRSWAWQFLFPGPYMGESGGGDERALRTHTRSIELRQAIEQAARMAELDQPMSEKILRNSFAAHLLQRGVALADVEKLLGVGPGDRSRRARGPAVGSDLDSARSASGF